MKKKPNPLKEEKARTNKWKDKYEEKNEHYEAVLSRELILIKKCRELEIENDKLKKELEKKMPYVNNIDFNK